VAKSKTVKEEWHVALWEEDAYRIFVGRPECGDHLKDPGLGERIILKWIFTK